MSENVVLTNANDEQILPVTTAENVFYNADKTVKEELDSLNSNLGNINKQAVIIGTINGINQYVELDFMEYREIVFRINVSDAYILSSFTPVVLYNSDESFILNFYESASANLTLIFSPKNNRLTLSNMAITGWVLGQIEIVGVY